MGKRCSVLPCAQTHLENLKEGNALTVRDERARDALIHVDVLGRDHLLHEAHGALDALVQREGVAHGAGLFARPEGWLLTPRGGS